MSKSRDAFRTISEVAELLDTPAHVLRFWESKFTQVKPVKRAGGRRYYRPGDIALIAGIKKLLHEDGLTIKGAQKVLREQGVKHVSTLVALPIDPEFEGDDIEDAPYTEVMTETATVLPFAPSDADGSAQRDLFGASDAAEPDTDAVLPDFLTQSLDDRVVPERPDSPATDENAAPPVAPPEPEIETAPDAPPPAPDDTAPPPVPPQDPPPEDDAEDTAAPQHPRFASRRGTDDAVPQDADAAPEAAALAAAPEPVDATPGAEDLSGDTSEDPAGQDAPATADADAPVPPEPLAEGETSFEGADSPPLLDDAHTEAAAEQAADEAEFDIPDADAPPPFDAPLAADADAPVPPEAATDEASLDAPDEGADSPTTLDEPDTDAASEQAEGSAEFGSADEDMAAPPPPAAADVEAPTPPEPATDEAALDLPDDHATATDMNEPEAAAAPAVADGASDPPKAPQDAVPADEPAPLRGAIPDIPSAEDMPSAPPGLLSHLVAVDRLSAAQCTRLAPHVAELRLWIDEHADSRRK